MIMSLKMSDVSTEFSSNHLNINHLFNERTKLIGHEDYLSPTSSFTGMSLKERTTHRKVGNVLQSFSVPRERTWNWSAQGELMFNHFRIRWREPVPLIASSAWGAISAGCSIIPFPLHLVVITFAISRPSAPTLKFFPVQIAQNFDMNIFDS